METWTQSRLAQTPAVPLQHAARAVSREMGPAGSTDMSTFSSASSLHWALVASLGHASVSSGLWSRGQFQTRSLQSLLHRLWAGEKSWKTCTLTFMCTQSRSVASPEYVLLGKLGMTIAPSHSSLRDNEKADVGCSNSLGLSHKKCVTMFSFFLFWIEGWAGGAMPSSLTEMDHPS